MNVRLVPVVLATVLAACGGTDEERGASRELAAVALPDLGQVDPSVTAQTRERYEALTRLRDSGRASEAELGAAYGEYGMLLHAAELLEAAEPAYRNAERLTPRDVRWPYYLGHLHRTAGDLPRAIAAFERALALRPDDVPALVWLGRSHLDLGAADEAQPYFAKAQSLAPALVAAQVGLGQVALARKEFARAAELLESALATRPAAQSIHAPLAMAYRGLGETAKAEATLTQWRNTELPLDDPLMNALAMTVESGLSYELRGVRALETQNWPEAVRLFREGIALTSGATPLGRSLRHKLGTALYMSGDLPGALQQFEEVTRLAPDGGLDESAAKAFYSLGIVRASEGRTGEAVTYLLSALQYQPAYLEARLAVADLLRRGGRVPDALPHFEAAIRMNPRAAEARFGYAMALVRLRRYADARAFLEESVRVQPDRPELAHALARLLAAAPDAAVRDGQRAMALVQQLLTGSQTTEIGETLAMAAAETGDYAKAVGIQREILDAARRAGMRDDVRRMTENLRLYEAGRPSRTPWPDDHAVHTEPLP